MRPAHVPWLSLSPAGLVQPLQREWVKLYKQDILVVETAVKLACKTRQFRPQDVVREGNLTASEAMSNFS
eukprot:IDg3535t1